MTTASAPKRPRASSASPNTKRGSRISHGQSNPFAEQQSGQAAFADKAPDKPANVQTRLREARLEKNLTLEECANYLCIRRVQLEAIENGKFKGLPSIAHGIGFIRSYADYLGLPADKIVDQYRRETRNTPDRTELHFPVPVNDNRLPSRRIIFLSFILLVLLISGWNWQARKMQMSVATIDEVETAPEEQPATVAAASTTPPAETVAIESDIPPAPTAAPAAPAPAKTGTAYGDAATAGRIELYAEHDTWMQVRDAANAIVFSRVLHAGDSYRVPSQAGMTLTVGNAAGLQIKVDGAALPSLGGPGQIVKNMPLDPDTLKGKATAQ